MKILVVHDRTEVLNKIVDLLVENGCPKLGIVTAEDGASTRAALEHQHFDVAIIDLTIPSVKGKSAAGYSAAEDLFTEMFYGTSIYNVPGDIIGISREAGALDNINTSIGPHLMAIVSETKDGAWEARLIDRVTYARRSTAARLRSLTRRHDYDVAFITALDEEMSPLKDLFTHSDVAAFPGALEFAFTDMKGVLRRGVALSVGSAGQAACASHAQAMIGYFRPKLFLMVGFCGGMVGKVSAGQVLFFQTVFDWDSGKWTEEKRSPQFDEAGKLQEKLPKPTSSVPIFVPRAEPLSIKDSQAIRVGRRIKDAGLSSHLKVQKMAAQLSANEIDRVDFDIVTAASGSAVVGHQEVLNKIRLQNDKIWAVDMESFGFYSASKFTPYVKPEALCIKAVADFCDGAKSDLLHAACCYLAAKTAEDMILNHWDFDAIGGD